VPTGFSLFASIFDAVRASVMTPTSRGKLGRTGGG